MTRSSLAENAVRYRRLLVQNRARLLAGIVPRRSSGAGDERFALDDQAQVSHDEFVSLHLSSLDYLKLRLIDEALDRLGTGDYGICLGCDQAIPDKRLKALPWARYCVACQDLTGEAEEKDLVDSRPRTFSLPG